MCIRDRGYILIDKQIIKIPGIAKENNTVEKEEKAKITEIEDVYKRQILRNRRF